MSLITGPYILGISEKPQAARRLARAIDEEGRPERKRINNIPVYICFRDGKTIVIIPAIGHLFTLSQKGQTWNYPTLDIQWVPTHKEHKNARTKNFVETFSSLSSEAEDIIIMTDYDREGEVIGYLIMKYALNRDSAQRMKFSTLTKRDIEAGYAKREDTYDVGLLNAGLLRHYVDWLYGINYSRALSLSYQRIADRFKTISIGRVQGPTLAFIVDKEKEIGLFVPTPYWAIDSEVYLGDEKFKAKCEHTELDSQTQAQTIVDNCSSLLGIILDITEQQNPIYNYPPFNLSDLQRQAYHHFKFSPSTTLQIAETLYLKAIISYPRTDSQKLPMTLGHKQILTKLAKRAQYSPLAKEILSKKKFKPYEGKKTDAAHPAIHPTGNPLDAKTSENERKLYDLIVKRYLSLFARKGTQLEKEVIISVNNHKFSVFGQKIIEEGWIKYYKPYISFPEVILPDIKPNMKVKFDYIRASEHFTDPPYRYNEASLLKKMEDEKIGTKATRADIISRLFDRGYIEGQYIKPTSFGKAIESVLAEYNPLLITPAMTRNLEDLMDDIQEGKKNMGDELIRIKHDLYSSLIEFNKQEEEIGLSLYHNLKDAGKSDFIVLGSCPVCDVGELRIIKSRSSGKKFVACSAYIDESVGCDVTYPLPTYRRKITPTTATCPHDGLPLVEFRKGRKKITACIDPDCPSRNEGA